MHATHRTVTAHSPDTVRPTANSSGAGSTGADPAAALGLAALPMPAGRPLEPQAAVSVRGLRKSFGKKEILHGLDFDIPRDSIVGLLGRNGAGKTTALSLLAGQEAASAGDVSVLGRDPFEDAITAARLCFARENQKYPESFRPAHVLKSAPWFFEHWDQGFAERLVRMFRLPVETKIGKLSRGQLSAVAIVVGLASRAPLTFFDEPYLGLDATARQLFYDVMLQDYAEHPRTIVMSTHLIDEAADLLEKVLVIDDGRILMDADADTARSAAFSLSGPAAAVRTVSAGWVILHERRIGGLASVTLAGRPDDALRVAADEYRLEIGPVGLQDLVAALGSRPSDTLDSATDTATDPDGVAVPTLTSQTTEEQR